MSYGRKEGRKEGWKEGRKGKEGRSISKHAKKIYIYIEVNGTVWIIYIIIMCVIYIYIITKNAMIFP